MLTRAQPFAAKAEFAIANGLLNVPFSLSESSIHSATNDPEREVGQLRP